MMLCEKSFRPFSKRSEGMSRFTATLPYTRSFCEFVGVWIVNIFSSVNHVLANIALRLVVETNVCRIEHLLNAHRSRKTVAFLTAHVPDFDEPENWPPNSPDLNPVDYVIWGVLQQIVCRQRIRDIEHLEKVLTACWDEISQDTINRAFRQFCKRLSLVIAANGGHIEHHLD